MCCAAGSHHDLDVEYGEHDNSSPVCWLERFPYKEDVIGSSPVGPTTRRVDRDRVMKRHERPYIGGWRSAFTSSSAMSLPVIVTKTIQITPATSRMAALHKNPVVKPSTNAAPLGPGS